MASSAAAQDATHWRLGHIVTPKYWCNPKFIHLVNQNHRIVAQHLCQCLVDLGRGRFASERVAKLPLDHAERGLRVAPFVVVGEEFVAAVEEVAQTPFAMLPCRDADYFQRRCERS